jgi:hypothetical protein
VLIHRPTLIALLVAIGLALSSGPGAHAQEMIFEESAMGLGMGSLDSGSTDMLAPPWHGSVRGRDCGPSCPPPTMFHADPCGQLFAGTRFHPGCVTRPPCFPRLHGWWVDGLMPTPRPPALPRCHQCGATIEGGF